MKLSTNNSRYLSPIRPEVVTFKWNKLQHRFLITSIYNIKLARGRHVILRFIKEFSILKLRIDILKFPSEIQSALGPYVSWIIQAQPLLVPPGDVYVCYVGYPPGTTGMQRYLSLPFIYLPVTADRLMNRNHHVIALRWRDSAEITWTCSPTIAVITLIPYQNKLKIMNPP